MTQLRATQKLEPKLQGSILMTTILESPTSDLTGESHSTMLKPSSMFSHRGSCCATTDDIRNNVARTVVRNLVFIQLIS